MSLCILNVAYPFAAVGPSATGDAERLVTELDAALARDGHDSVVIASEGSEANGILVAMPRPGGRLDNATRRKVYQQYRATLQQLLEKWRFDVVHMHGMDFPEYLPPAGVPVLATLHLPLCWYPGDVFRLERPQTFLECVAPEQKEPFPCPHLLLKTESEAEYFRRPPPDRVPAGGSAHELVSLDQRVENYLAIYQRLAAGNMPFPESTDFVEDAKALAV